MKIRKGSLGILVENCQPQSLVVEINSSSKNDVTRTVIKTGMFELGISEKSFCFSFWLEHTKCVRHPQ